MRTREMQQYLKDHGFSLMRQGTKHPIYSDGQSKIILSNGSSSPNFRLAASLRTEVRRAIEKRPVKEEEKKEMMNVITPIAPPPSSEKISATLRHTMKLLEAIDNLEEGSKIVDVLAEAEISQNIFYYTVQNLVKTDDVENLFKLQEAFRVKKITCSMLDREIKKIEEQTSPPPEPAIIIKKAETPTMLSIEKREAPTTSNQQVFLDVCQRLMALSPEDRRAVMAMIDSFIKL